MNTGDAGPQPTAQVQLTLASWHPGGHLTRIEEEMQAKAAAGGWSAVAWAPSSWPTCSNGMTSG